MITILGSNQKAASMINEKIRKEAMNVGKDQSLLTELFPVKQTHVGKNNNGGKPKNGGKKT